MSSHTNVSIGIYGCESFDQEQAHVTKKEYHLLQAELDFYKNKSTQLAKELENIPEAVKKYSYVNITYGQDRKEMTIVQKVED